MTRLFPAVALATLFASTAVLAGDAPVAADNEASGGQSRKGGIENELGLLAAGRQFLEENAKKEGVVTTPSGLQYQVIEEGSGESPGPADTVTVNYRGTLVDGSVFDSSAKHGGPATFKLDAVIKGWSEGLQLMKEGGKAKLFIPQELAYGQRGPLAHRALIFDVELISVGEPEAGSTE